ncbi:MAG: DUF998 domain-containing protein [Candidatus Koribacter versatilis]|uniref:DUF998 domain-containing protein n=1 Tax=Candidatus Korobacter versatilis TaxID=658062 RepID=A0A932A6K1_9BACT|nr:DUF998 domain-containing protein [Candidatus Koribacter versatilis]
MNFTEVAHGFRRKLQEPTGVEANSYRLLRKVVGVLGCALPFAVWWGAWLYCREARQPSISAYYYTSARNILVGTLCAIGIVLVCYRGPQVKDRLASLLAGGFGIGVALFPTTPEHPTPVQDLVGTLHYTFAAIFFLAITGMVLLLFTINGKGTWRNKLFWACGLVMLACVVIMGTQALLSDDRKLAWKASGWTFVLETAAIEAFGVAWLVKGGAGGGGGEGKAVTRS